MPGSLEALAPGVYAWLTDVPSHHETNSGVVVAADGLTVFDVGPTPDAASELVEALRALTELPVKRLVLSGSHIDVVGGATAFALAGVYGSAQTSHHLDQEPNPAVWQKLHPEHDFAEVETRPVSHTVTENAHLCPASIAVPVPGPQFESLVMQVPGANVVFAGAVATFGVVPLGFEADFPKWISTLDQLVEWGEIFVPSHGSIGGREDVLALRNYLEAVIAAGGQVQSMPDGPWDDWAQAQFTAINVERAHMLANGDPSPPPSMLTLIGMA